MEQKTLLSSSKIKDVNINKISSVNNLTVAKIKTQTINSINVNDIYSQDKAKQSKEVSLYNNKQIFNSQTGRLKQTIVADEDGNNKWIKDTYILKGTTSKITELLKDVISLPGLNIRITEVETTELSGTVKMINTPIILVQLPENEENLYLTSVPKCYFTSDKLYYSISLNRQINEYSIIKILFIEIY